MLSLVPGAESRVGMEVAYASNPPAKQGASPQGTPALDASPTGVQVARIDLAISKIASAPFVSAV